MSWRSARFIAGRFSATYDPPGGTTATDIGIMQEGYTLSWRIAAQAIQPSDQHGDAFIDGVLRGISDMFLESESLEAKTGSYLALTPLQALAATGVTYIGPGVIGRLMSDVAGITILTSTAATPAASTPASITATYSHLAENFDARLLLNSKLRTIPLRMRILPYLDTVIKYVTAT